MKRFRTRRNGKHIDLVELVRNRFRFQPYRFHSNANISSRSSTRIAANVRSSRFASSENLPKNQRLRLGRSKRTGVATRSAAEGEPRPSCSVSASPPCSSRHTHRDETSQTSIPKELRHLLVDDTKHSEEEDEEVPSSATETSVEAEEHSSNTNTEESTSNTAVTEQQDVSKLQSCSNEQQVSASSSAAVQVMVDSDPDEPYEPYETETEGTEETEDTEDPRETEDGEDTEDTEEAHDTISADERNEHVSDLDNFLHERRSQVLPEEEAPADEEAGGDGHHNNSVIEIEITLTSGNDSNSNSEDDENETDDIGDEGSEDI